MADRGKAVHPRPDHAGEQLRPRGRPAQRGVGLVELRADHRLAVEGLDDPHSGQIFPGDAVYFVQRSLDFSEKGKAVPPQR